MERICPVAACTGCMACYNSCARQAIVMEEDECGFRYPVIRQDKCVDCGLCAIVCPVNNPLKRHASATVFAAYSKDDDDRMSSTSGGAASVLARVTVENGGVVYGCVQESYRNIRHLRIDRVEQLYCLKGSKYVQSDIGATFRLVKKDLADRRRVLFTGTPCQIAGLHSFLQKDYLDLLTMDLVCHGVPSGRLLREEVQRILRKKRLPEGEYRVDFRKKGGHLEDLKYGIFLYDDTSSVFSADYPHDLYIAGFMTGLFHRESCYACPYANPERVSDITVCDYWGIGESALDTGRGISAMLLNTEKGIRFFETCREQLVCEERKVEEAVCGNGQLQRPSVRDRNYELFRKLYPSYGFAKAARCCLLPFYARYYLVDSMKPRLRKVPFVYSTYRLLKKIT